MQISQDPLSAATVSYEEAPVAQVEVEGVSYRVDAGHGSAVAISCREEGRWDWTPVLQGRWDGVQLKAKGLERSVRLLLEQALALATRAQADFD